MELSHKINLLSQLGTYLLSNDETWLATKERASYQNAWFTPEFVELAVQNIANQFLEPLSLQNWVTTYGVPAIVENPKKVGVVMAGNIPLVGFHDFLCVFISGHQLIIKPSSKDEVLIKHIIQKLTDWDNRVANQITFADTLKNCEAYIATGSSNSSRYFDYYFGKFPNIIRKNRTSVAVLDGTETTEDLQALANDILCYFGQGCRNVTKIYVPESYDFIPLLEALKSFNHFFEFHKYKNNYDYQLALLMMNKKYYMTNGSIVLAENESVFSPISQLNYSYYNNSNTLFEHLAANNDIQCIVGKNHIPFGSAQKPQLNDYADGVDTMQFLVNLYEK